MNETAQPNIIRSMSIKICWAISAYIYLSNAKTNIMGHGRIVRLSPSLVQPPAAVCSASNETSLLCLFGILFVCCNCLRDKPFIIHDVTVQAPLSVSISPNHSPLLSSNINAAGKMCLQCRFRPK